MNDDSASKYITVVGILIAVIWYSRFYTIILPQVGRGGDAAGAGMARGFSELIFYVVFGAYLCILIASGILLFADSRHPRLQTTLNVVILLPLFVFVMSVLGRLLNERMGNLEDARSYAKWRSLAQTRTIVDTADRFRFQCATYLKGTFGTADFAEISFIVTNDSAYLLGLNPGAGSDVGLIGKVGALVTPANEVPSMAVLQRAMEVRLSSPCPIELTKDHPLKQFRDDSYTVYQLLKGGLRPYADWERSSNPKLGKHSDFSRVFLVTHSAKPGLALEIVIAGGSGMILLGPLELNRSSESQVEWYETIQF